jgi:hypothetical protein
MPFNTLFLSAATVGMTTLAFAVATPASAQQYYAHQHYAHAHYAYAHTHYAHYRHHYESRQIVVHAQEPVVVQSPTYTTWGPVAAVGTVVGGTGEAVTGLFTGAGAVVGSFVGGVLGGTAALFGSPPTYAYGAPFAAPFNAAGAVAGAPFQVVGGAFGAPPPAVHASY